MASGLTFLTAYTWSKSISGPSDIGGQVGGGNFIGASQDVYNMQGDRAVSRLRRDAALRADGALRPAVLPRAHGAVTKLLLDGWQAVHDHDVPERLPGARSTSAWTRPAPASARVRTVTGQSRNPARRSADLEALVQYRRVRADAVRPFRHVSAHGRDPAARPGELRFLGEQDVFPMNERFRPNSGRRSSIC